MSPSLCEYRPCSAASLQAQALCLSSGLSAHPAARPATPLLSGTSPCSLRLSLAPSTSPGIHQPLLYTMTKSSAVLFILIFSLIFKLEELTPELAATAPHPTSARHWSWWSSSSPGVSSCSPTSPHSSTWRALPWCWGPHSSVAFAGPSPRCSCRRLNLASRIPSTPCSTCSHSCSWGSSLSLLYLKDTGLLLRVLGSLFLGGILAFGLGFSEFLLVSRTSSLTLSIAGIFKEVCTLLLAAHLLGDQISLLNWLGFALCLSGISLHVALKALHSRGDGGPKALKGLGSSPDLELLLRSSQREEGDNEEEEYFVAQGQQ
ncbi:solute carrier family 35 member C2 isoform X9 [Macaca fascicularis]|uniref:solute carrier family 35 member C2 isoform X9 n=1 Tax=Macaca fascicularis TaxID=9541 RepID=UPI0032B03BBC